jgi:hypothetical protein
MMATSVCLADNTIPLINNGSNFECISLHTIDESMTQTFKSSHDHH